MPVPHERKPWPHHPPLLDTDVDPPHFAASMAVAAVLTNSTRKLARGMMRSSMNSLDALGVDGRAALHWAVLLDREQVARFLLRKGASPMVHTWPGGETPRQYAERFGKATLAALLTSAAAHRDRNRNPTAMRGTSDDEPQADLSPSSMAPALLASSPPAPSTCCLHSCHGRGRCVDGMCSSCTNVGNASSLDCAALPATCPHDRRHGIFIGDLGLAVSRMKPTSVGKKTHTTSDCTGHPVVTLDPDLTGIYAPLDVFLLRLLKDQDFRAPSEACAQAVWHPLFARRLYHNLDEMLKWRLKAALATARLQAYTSSPSSLPPVGKDAIAAVPLPHLHEEHQDIGLCGSPLGVYRPGDVALTYWGDLTCHPPDTDLVVLPGNVRRSLRLHRTPGQWWARDPALVRIAKVAYSPGRLHAARRRQLLFRGSTREAKATPEVAAACFRPNRTAPCRDGVYSLGIRQTVQRVLGGHPLLNFSSERVSPGSYARLLLQFDFCLTAPGMGFGVRIIDYVAAGCIPVVVRPGKLRLPLEPDLDYSEFAVSVAFKDIAALPAVLAGLGEERTRRMREKLKDVHRQFLWDEEYGLAYEAVRDALARRLARHPARSGWESE